MSDTVRFHGAVNNFPGAITRPSHTKISFMDRAIQIHKDRLISEKFNPSKYERISKEQFQRLLWK